ncbi:MAG: hypothetical protein ACFFED_04605 [Candidatus Thorarchaeota archaeon]
MDLESLAKDYYEDALKMISNPSFRSILDHLAKRANVRLATLERIRRENITEMILEPIKGLDSDAYPYEMNPNPSTDDKDTLDLAINLEETRKKFFEAAGSKIEFLIEAADAFERLGDENAENLESLKAYL